MSKKLPWPVAKVREDGTPAIWLTFTNWLVVKSGIQGTYLQERSHFGYLRARNEARKKFGPGWQTHPELGRCTLTDAWSPLFSHESAALELYRAGWNAWCATDEKSRGATLSPEQLVALGDKHERKGYEGEIERLKNLSCNAAQAESVTVIAPDQPKTVSPGDRSVPRAAVAVNPGRALEVAVLEVAA